MFGTCIVCKAGSIPLANLLLDYVSLLESWGGVACQRCFKCNKECHTLETFLVLAARRRSGLKMATESLTSMRDEKCFEACRFMKNMFWHVPPLQLRDLTLHRQSATAMVFAAALFPESKECRAMAKHFKSEYLAEIAETARIWHQGDGMQTNRETAYLAEVAAMKDLISVTCGELSCTRRLTQSQWKAEPGQHTMNSARVSLRMIDPLYGFMFETHCVLPVSWINLRTSMTVWFCVEFKDDDMPDFSEDGWLTKIAIHAATNISVGDNPLGFLRRTIVDLSNLLATSATPDGMVPVFWDPRDDGAAFSDWPVLVLLLAKLLAGAKAMAGGFEELSASGGRQSACQFPTCSMP